MSEKAYLTAGDIQNLLGVSRSKAYQIIKKLNGELQEKGYLVVSGKISKRYFEENDIVNIG